MEVKEQPLLRFNGVDIVKLNVDLKKPFEPAKDIQIFVTPKVFYPIGNDSNFTIIMDLKLVCEEFFDISLSAFGDFFMSNAKAEEFKPFVNVNAPAIMFPYVRAFISTLTSNMGKSVPPILLPAQFFQGELEEVKFNSEEVAQTEPS